MVDTANPINLKALLQQNVKALAVNVLETPSSRVTVGGSSLVSAASSGNTVARQRSHPSLTSSKHLHANQYHHLNHHYQQQHPRKSLLIRNKTLAHLGTSTKASQYNVTFMTPPSKYSCTRAFVTPVTAFPASASSQSPLKSSRQEISLTSRIGGDGGNLGNNGNQDSFNLAQQVLARNRPGAKPALVYFRRHPNPYADHLIGNSKPTEDQVNLNHSSSLASDSSLEYQKKQQQHQYQPQLRQYHASNFCGYEIDRPLTPLILPLSPHHRNQYHRSHHYRPIPQALLSSPLEAHVTTTSINASPLPTGESFEGDRQDRLDRKKSDTTDPNNSTFPTTTTTTTTATFATSPSSSSSSSQVPNTALAILKEAQVAQTLAIARQVSLARRALVSRDTDFYRQRETRRIGPQNSLPKRQSNDSISTTDGNNTSGHDYKPTTSNSIELDIESELEMMTRECEVKSRATESSNVEENGSGNNLETITVAATPVDAKIVMADITPSVKKKTDENGLIGDDIEKGPKDVDSKTFSCRHITDSKWTGSNTQNIGNDKENRQSLDQEPIMELELDDEHEELLNEKQSSHRNEPRKQKDIKQPSPLESNKISHSIPLPTSVYSLLFGIEKLSERIHGKRFSKSKSKLLPQSVQTKIRGHSPGWNSREWASVCRMLDVNDTRHIKDPDEMLPFNSLPRNNAYPTKVDHQNTKPFPVWTSTLTSQDMQLKKQYQQRQEQQQQQLDKIADAMMAMMDTKIPVSSSQKQLSQGGKFRPDLNASATTKHPELKILPRTSSKSHTVGRNGSNNMAATKVPTLEASAKSITHTTTTTTTTPSTNNFMIRPQHLQKNQALDPFSKTVKIAQNNGWERADIDRQTSNKKPKPQQQSNQPPQVSYYGAGRRHGSRTIYQKARAVLSSSKTKKSTGLEIDPKSVISSPIQGSPNLPRVADPWPAEVLA